MMSKAPLGLIIVLAVGAFAAWLGWVGFIESDDLFYADAARNWVAHFPFVASNHWGLRHMIVLPIAASFAVGGVGESTLVLPLTCYFLLFLAMSYWVLVRLVGSAAAVLATCLLALTPLFSTLASFVVTDLVETLFVIASFWFFYFAPASRHRRTLLLLAGLCAGFAWITRETSLVLIVFYGVLFLLGRRIPRLEYFWIAGGFLVVVGLDTAYLASASGDLLYRYHMTLKGVAGDNPIDQAARFPVQNGFDRHGVVAAPHIVQPIIMLFTSHQFGFLFFLAVPALAALFRSRPGAWPSGPVPLLCLLGALWFVILSYGIPSLWVQPRYQTVLVYCTVLIVAVWIADLARGRRSLAVALTLLLVASDVVLIYLDSNDLLFGERALVAFAERSNETIETDPMTRASADFLLRIKGLGDHVAVGSPAAGALFFENIIPHRPLSPVEAAAFKPQPGWQIVGRIDETPGLGARLLHGSGLEAYLPIRVRQRLDPPPRGGVLYRVP
jgi:4-amino-4-deoxy-L-arabinose transferase-like glycosyltransferase